MKEKIKNTFKDRLTTIGFSSIDRFYNAPKNHHPANILKNAKTVIVIAKNIPKGIINTINYTQHFIHRSQHSIYQQLDNLSLEIIKIIENESYNAIPIPAFVPLTINKYMPRGILSLKHAAVNAGIGLFGKNDLVYNEKYGSLLRFAAIITDMKLEPDQLIDKKTYCPEECEICIKSCSVKAIKKGYFNYKKCNNSAIYHGVNPLILFNLNKIEKFINTTYDNYWMNCSECILKCPLNKKNNCMQQPLCGLK